MKQCYSLKICKNLFLCFALSIFVVFGIQSQNEKPKEINSLQEENKIITIDNISDETEKIGQRIYNLREILRPSTEISKVDTILKNLISKINVKKDSLISLLDKMSRRELTARKVEWNNYHTQVKVYQSVLNNRVNDLSKINDELIEEEGKWKRTKEKLAKRNKSSDIYDSLDSVILTLEEVLKITHKRLDNIFTIQKNLTEFVLSINEMIDEIAGMEQQMQRDYFVFDSKPIWEIGSIDSVATESKLDSTKISKTQFRSVLSENKRQIKEFVFLNAKTVVFQFIFILMVLVFLLIVNKKWKNDFNETTSTIEADAKIVLSHPIAATTVVGILISFFFYDALVPILSEIHLFIIFAGTIVLLPKLTNKRFLKFLSFLALIYLLRLSEDYIGSKSIIRWLKFGEAGLLIYTLILGIKTLNKTPQSFKRIIRLFQSVVPLYVFISFLSIIANFIGMTGLASFLIKGVLFSTILGIVVFLGVKVILSISVLFFKLRMSSNLNALTSMVEATNQRFRPMLYWIGSLVWIYFTLKAFELYDFLINWLDETLLIDLVIGEMSISLGGILAFFGVFIATMIFAKLVATIFQDDWMVKVLPRGVAPAVSLLSRIILVSIGIYIALSAAGVNLSKLGFLIGALGVGIGFGLQNIVLNFIAGLILAFERPINIGDTIEIDQEFGVVTNIGLRSSNIKTYSGAEAIIPNGDLISKKVINWTLKNRDRRSKILLKTSPNANPEKAISLFIRIASDHPNTYENPEPITFFKGYAEDGNLQFELLYWTTFSDTLTANHDIALQIFVELKKEGIQAPAPVRRIIND